ncbi:hypothetical protein Csa_005384 [Cucumis sativus]|uniref:Uncharacterized protein n=1 Tax=Cucumis sativus TaxID=3659 RepID=A0A0A0KA43_CUCSA|nr:hypothetical protein Csa_005384 [Cucumis sativus]
MNKYQSPTQLTPFQFHLPDGVKVSNFLMVSMTLKKQRAAKQFLPCALEDHGAQARAKQAQGHIVEIAHQWWSSLELAAEVDRH